MYRPYLLASLSVFATFDLQFVGEDAGDEILSISEVCYSDPDWPKSVGADEVILLTKGLPRDNFQVVRGSSRHQESLSLGLPPTPWVGRLGQGHSSVRTTLFSLREFSFILPAGRNQAFSNFSEFLLSIRVLFHTLKESTDKGPYYTKKTP